MEQLMKITEIRDERITKKGEKQFLVKYKIGPAKWVPEKYLSTCPEKIEDFRECCRKREIINTYNRLNGEKPPFGFQRPRAINLIEKVVGGMMLEEIPVVEITWKHLECSELVLWEEAREKIPHKLLEFYFNFITSKMQPL